MQLLKMKNSVKYEKNLKTAALYFSFFALGLCASIPGPTLLDLQQIVQTETSKITFIYLARSGGYLLGSLMGGVVFDLIKSKQLLLMLLNLLMSVSMLAVPWSRSIEVLIGILTLGGIAMGGLDTGGNVLCLNIWGKDSGPYYQGLHFIFGLGAFVAPLIAEPFLSKPCTFISDDMNSSNINTTVNNSLTIESFKNCPIEFPPPVTYSYSIVGGYSCLVTLMFVILVILWPLEHHEIDNDETATKNNKKPQHKMIYVISVVFVTQLLIGIYCGIEIGYGQMLTTFAVKGDLKLTKSEGTFITAVFWGVFTFSRGIGVILASKFKPFVLVFGDLVVMVTACALLFAMGSSSVIYLWIGTVVLATGLASFYPSTVSWIQEHVHLNNKMLSFFVISAAAGEMLVPVTVSQYIESMPHMLMYIILGCAIAGSVTAAILWLLIGRKNNRHSHGVSNMPKKQETTM